MRKMLLLALTIGGVFFGETYAQATDPILLHARETKISDATLSQEDSRGEVCHRNDVAVLVKDETEFISSNDPHNASSLLLSASFTISDCEGNNIHTLTFFGEIPQKGYRVDAFGQGSTLSINTVMVGSDGERHRIRGQILWFPVPTPNVSAAQSPDWTSITTYGETRAFVPILKLDGVSILENAQSLPNMAHANHTVAVHP